MPPPDPRAVVDAFVSVLGRERVLDGESTAPYAVDGLTPAAVVRPATAEELAAVLAEASRLEAVVIPWGGGTAMTLGNLPLAYDLAVEACSLDRVIEYEPADLTITVEAGITLAKLQEVLGQNRQFFPLDPPGGQQATLGGALASGVSGPSRHAYGPARDWVLGLRVAHADGRLSRGGGRVVKNVAGYDMPKLYLGSLGTLGVIVEASLKVMPLPPAEATWLALPKRSLAMAEAASLALDIHRRGLRLRALAIMRSDEPLPDIAGDGIFIAAWVCGSEGAVERSLWELDGVAAATGLEARRLDTSEGASLWEAVRNSCRTSSEAEAVVRASFLPSQAATLLKEMEALKPHSLVAYPAVGVAYARFDATALWARSVTHLRQTVPPEKGGAVIVEACPRSLKGRIDVFGEPQEDFPLMQRIKEQMDPRGILNRGRFLGRL